MAQILPSNNIDLELVKARHDLNDHLVSLDTSEIRLLIRLVKITKTNKDLLLQLLAMEIK